MGYVAGVFLRDESYKCTRATQEGPELALVFLST